MKLSEYIAGLQAFMEEYGDLPCFYASDDEGNDYQSVGSRPSLLWTFDTDEYHPDMYCQERAEEFDDFNEMSSVCVVN